MAGALAGARQLQATQPADLTGAATTLNRARKQLGLQTRQTAEGWIVEV